MSSRSLSANVFKIPWSVEKSGESQPFQYFTRPFITLSPADNAKQIARIEAILLQALEADPDDPASTDEILNHLYETSLADAKLASDPHHLIHHLSSVIKPPIADYTSITDCIDTSTVDRPPSPQIAHLQPRRERLNSNLADINDFSLSGGGDPAGRQESEMLRLAEESQHVIISQLVNKIVSMDDEREAEGGPKVSEEDETGRRAVQRPLNALDRNSSQIFYAQSQANVLCGNVMEEVEEERL